MNLPRPRLALAVAFLSCIAGLAAACGSDDASSPFDAGQLDATAPDAGPHPEAGRDAAIDGAADARDGSSMDATQDPAVDAMLDGGVDGTDAAVESGADASSEGSTDTGTDAGPEAGTDGGSDAGADAAGDASPDAAADASIDAAQDGSGIEAGSDAADAGPGPVLLVLAGGAANIVGGSFNGSSWTTTALTGTTTSSIALGITSARQGVGLIRGAANQLAYATWAGSWVDFAPVATDTTRGAPTLSPSGIGVQAVFHGLDYKFYYAAFDGATWNPVAEPVGGAASQSYGPIAPSVATLGTDATLGFIDGANANGFTTQDRTGSVWQGKVLVGTPTNLGTPTVTALTAGPELMGVYERANDNQVMFATRTAGVWSAPAPVANALSYNPPSLVGLPGGSTLLAFRGTDGNAYYATYAAGAWSAVGPLASPNIAVAAAPSVAPGVGGMVAEMALVETNGNAYHTRFNGSTWSPPVFVASGFLLSAIIASAP
jgi:hypothetical protein